MSRQTLTNRLAILERRAPSQRIPMHLVETIAAEFDLTAGEVLAEMERTAREFADHGLTTWPLQRTYLAAEWGCSEDEVDALIRQGQERVAR